MIVNAISLRRPTNSDLFLVAAAVFPLLVLIGYFKSYYFSGFFLNARQSRIRREHGSDLSVGSRRDAWYRGDSGAEMSKDDPTSPAEKQQ